MGAALRLLMTQSGRSLISQFCAVQHTSGFRTTAVEGRLRGKPNLDLSQCGFLAIGYDGFILNDN